MKKLLSLTLALSVCITAFAQSDIKEINKSLAKINDKLYASKYEVSNKLYATFLKSFKPSDHSNEWSSAQIDTLKWRDKLSFNEPYVHYYHSHPAYQNYPVVNISYEGAKLFCEWLTQYYNANPKRKFKKVLFRLPSEKEWMMAAQGGDSTAIYPWKGQYLRNIKGCMLCNFSSEINDSSKDIGRNSDKADITAQVNAYWENSFGLFNMSGNVAEMIAEKGIAKGGSWKDKAELLKINSKYNYDGNAQTNVGFRYFAEIIEK